MTPAEVVAGIGKVARAAARSEGSLSEFDHDQLLSAYSATRHLAVELSAYQAELRRFAAELAKIAPPPWAERLLEGEPSSESLGLVVSELLGSVRADESPAARELQARVRSLVRGLADREVDLLAEGLS